MLTATQTKYARERVNAIFRRKEEKLQTRYNEQGKRTNEEKINLIALGHFELDLEGSHYRWYDAIKFPDPVQQITPAQYAEANRALKAERDAIVDELVLGDAEGALAAIKRFEESPDGLAE